MPADTAHQTQAPDGGAALPLLLRQRAAWTYLGLSRACWYRAKAGSDFPKAVDVAGVPHWRRSDLDRWAERLKSARPRKRREIRRRDQQPE
jgi:predicted DNA-binding transcriptional regulator AlpA